MIHFKAMLGTSMMMLLISSISTVSSQCPTTNGAALDPSVNDQLKIARMNFSLAALLQSSQIESEDNIFFSPYSIHEALYLTYLGAGGKTEQDLQKALSIPENLTKIDALTFYGQDKSIKKFALEFNETKDYDFTTANRLYISSGKKVRECMLAVLGDDLEKTDFKTDPAAARMNINNWVSNTTKGHIEELIPSDGIDSSTDLVLVNAVYFKGIWQSKFNLNESKRAAFYGTKISQVTYMRQNRTFNNMVSEVLGAHVLQLPYKGENVSMFVFLPPAASLSPNQNTIKTLVQKMTTTEDGLNELHDILNGEMQSTEVHVSFPRFTIEKELPMGPFLEALGVGDLMKANQADLRGFVEDEEGLHLGDAVHKAKIELNEEGTTAAAATALFSFRSSRPAEPAVFNANHPFVYLIYNRVDESILFCGIYRTPVAPTETPTS